MYNFVSTLDPVWIIVAAIGLLALDIFVLNTTILLLLAATLLLFAGMLYVVTDPVIQTWSFVVFLFLAFLFQRPLVKLVSAAPSPYRESRQDIKMATIQIVETTNLASSHFYDFKDDKQFVTETKNDGIRSMRAVTEDGASYPIEPHPDLKSGDRVRIAIHQNGKAVIKNVGK